MKKTTEMFAAELLDRHSLILTSEYLGAHYPITFLCVNQHENKGMATNILQRGYSCKHCKLGYSVVPKTDWTDETTLRMLDLLEINSTEEVAKKLNTTVSAIRNRLAKLELNNPSSRLAKLKLDKVLSLQERVLVSEFNYSKALVTVRCREGHTVTQQASNIISHNTNCPKCLSLGTSNGESELLAFIRSIYSGWVELKDRTILNGKELDIVLPDLGIAIEYNGTYWHREDKLGRAYHKGKTEEVEAFGFQLLHIKDYDWVTKPEIIKSMLRSKLGVLSTKIYARKCEVRSISFPADFLNCNHIQGAGQPTSNNLGLFFKDELVAVATFASPRYDKDADLELIRYCTLLNTTVVGGLSKLLSRVPGRIVSYAARDYSKGNAYMKCGFTLTRNTDPGLEFYKRYTKISRYKAQSLSDKELASYTKYYNSGSLVFHRG